MLHGKMGVVFGLEDQRHIAVDFSFSFTRLMKCWPSSKLIEESALKSTASLYPWQKVSS